jgi:hypothetical protein
MKNKGFGTIELVILIAILVGVALLFKTFIVDYAVGLMDDIQSVEIDIKNIDDR